jgi:ribosomal RNA-processing protein 12
LSQSAYSILSELFSSPAQNEDNTTTVDISGVLTAMLSSPPSKSDFTLSSAWVQVLGNAVLAYSFTDPEACAVEIDKVWKSVWPFLESSDASVRKVAAESLGSFARCFTPSLIALAIQEVGQAETRSTLGKIVVETTNALDSLAFARSMPELLSVISSLIDNLGHRQDWTSPPPAESLLLPLIQKVGELRIQKGFEYKEAADGTLAIAMRVIGPEVLFQVLPLNLEPSDRYVCHTTLMARS